jgi:succinyl-diaminopimelate desuccinylase
MIKTFEKLITFPTVTADVAANREALRWCQAQLKGKGIDSELFDCAGRPMLEWGAPLSRARIMLNTHIDVVPAEPEQFRPFKREGRLLGRGAADTKAMAAVFLSLSAAEHRLAARRGIRFMFVSDEETGGESTKQRLEAWPKLEFALFGEPTGLELSIEAKGIMQIKLTARGQAAHGSRTWMGRNAIVDLSARIQKFLAEQPIATKETWETTFNFSLFSGGKAINQVPDRAELCCDVRFMPEDQPDRIRDLFRQHFGADNVEILRSESPVLTPRDNPFIRQLAALVKAEVGEAVFRREFGSSDARHCTARGIPTAVFGPVGGNFHAKAEWVDLKTVAQAGEIIKAALKAL